MEATEGGITLSWQSIVLLVGGLGCAGVVGLFAWFVYWGVSVGSRPSWHGYAERIVRRSRAAHSEVRLAVQQSPKHIRKTLAKALLEADRLLERQQDMKNAAIRIGRGLGRINLRRLQNDLRSYTDKEAREPNPRVRAQYVQARKALEAQVAHYNAVTERLRRMLEAMREIQSTLEAMQPRVARLTMYEVDTDTDVDMAASREVLEDLDLLIGELEAIETDGSLSDIELIQREVEKDAQRRVQEGQLEFDQDPVAPQEVGQ
jgi:hypothetical protein